MDHPPPNHLRLRDSALLGRFGRFLPPFGRRFRRHGAPCTARPGRGGGGGPGLDGHAHPARGRLGVGELEVPEARGGWGHDLRALDAHAEAGAGGWIQDLDRRVAGGRAHGRRRALRRRRGRRERVPNGGGGACAPAGRRCAGGPATPAPKARTRRRVRAASAGPSAPTGGPGRATRGHAQAAPAADEQRAGERQRRAAAHRVRRPTGATRPA